MILPSKTLRAEEAVLGIGAFILSNLGRPAELSFLWERTKSYSHSVNYERFLFALNLLYVLGLVTFSDNRLHLVNK